MPESLSSFWATGKHWKTSQQTCVTNDCTKRRFSALFWYPWHHRPRPVKICTYRRLRLKAAFQLPKYSLIIRDNKLAQPGEASSSALKESLGVPLQGEP